MKQELIVIDKIDQFGPLVGLINSNDYIAVDTETTGTDKDAKIIGLSFCADPSVGYYVITRAWDPETKKLNEHETCSAVKSLINLLISKNLVMHNATFDCQMIKNNYNIDLMPYVHTDTMILAHLLDENRHNGLKELGVTFFGEDAKTEQKAMKDSVQKNGGTLTKDNYELYKADAMLIAKYGAKDAILTIKLFYLLVEELFKQGLDKFFYEDESMPLVRGPTYDLNTVGLKVNQPKLQALKSELEATNMTLEASIYREIESYIKEKYPNTNKKNRFNIGSSKQLAWLLFVRLDNLFVRLTDSGRELCHAFGLDLPYTNAAKRGFIASVGKNKGSFYATEGKPKQVKDVWNYLAADKKTLSVYAKRYQWVTNFLEYNKNKKLLSTYIEGIQERLRYGCIHPNFLQHGTTSGRYSSKNPNFQNLPRGDRRIKACIMAREGKVFVGADYSQLEPRVFASISEDSVLLECFKSGKDFYSVIGAQVFDKNHLSLYKDEPNSFAKKHPDLRDKAKILGLATPYGRTAPYMAAEMNTKIDEAQELIDRYFSEYPDVHKMMLDSHEQVRKTGKSVSLFGRIRRIPEAKQIDDIYGNTPHNKLPYNIRNLLNLAMNHRVQSTAASIMNRAAIAVHNNIQELAKIDHKWKEVKIVLQVHDELILEGPDELGESMITLLKHCMENTTKLPGVDLIAEPKKANNLADLK